MRHSGAVAEFVDGHVEVVLGQGAGIGLGLCVVEVNFGGTHDDQVHIAVVVLILVESGDILVRMISGEGHLEVRGGCGFLAHALVTGSADARGKTGIAVLALGGEVHGFPAGLVGETGAILAKVTGSQFPGHCGAAHGTDGHAVASAVHGTVCPVVVAGDNHLVGQLCGVIGMEKLEVAGMQAVAAAVDEIGRNLCALIQIPLVALGIGRKSCQGRISSVIFAEGAFEKEHPGLQGHGGPLGHLISALGGGQLCNCEIEVFDHLVYDELAAVAGLVELCGFGGTDGFVVPRHIAEALDFREVEICAEETCESLVLGAHNLILAVGEFLYESVDIAEGGPAPAAAGCRDGAFAEAFRRHVVLGIVIVVGDVQVGAREQLIEADGESLELALALEEGVRSQSVLGNGVQKIVAAGE